MEGSQNQRQRNKRRLNKRGSIQDLIFVGGVLLFTAVVVLISFAITSKINDQVQDMDDIMPATASNATSDLSGHFPGIFDNAFLLLVVGLGIGVMALAALVRFHPIFVVFFIIAMILLIFFSGVFSNIYQEMAENPELTAYADQLTFISHILEYFPFIIGIFATILMILMYKLGGTEGAI